MSTNIELHFQEGFTGQDVEISVDGRRQALITPVSRPQTGLAKIENICCQPGARISVRLGRDRHVTDMEADPRRPFILLNITDGHLTVAYGTSSPGYV